MSKATPTAALDARVVYRAPSGRLCCWRPVEGAARQITAEAHFQYVRGLAEAARPGSWVADGFVLTPANYRLLTPVGRL